MRDVLVMRGLPGSGKSTLAKRVAAEVPGSVIVSADAYFGDGPINVAIVYRAHTWCHFRFREALKRGAPLVIVDNTNTCKADIEPYMTTSVEFGYEALILEVPCDVETSIKRNIHGAPREHIERMANRLVKSPLDPSWKLLRYGG